MVDNVANYLTSMHVSVLDVDYGLPSHSLGDYYTPSKVDINSCHRPHASEGQPLHDQIAVDGAE